jgi:hypothetical protein
MPPSEAGGPGTYGSMLLPATSCRKSRFATPIVVFEDSEGGGFGAVADIVTVMLRVSSIRHAGIVAAQ